MSKVPLTPMLVQYLTALCCLRRTPEAVKITIGEMVEDEAAESTRDVDVTVTISESGSVTDAFMAYEVKHEGPALDVAKVESLCLKVNDMPTITHRAIVSTSGFSATAQKKAARHGVDLYQLKEWTRPLQEQFPLLEMTGTVLRTFPLTSSDTANGPTRCGPQWPHTHTLDVAADEVYFRKVMPSAA
ncbi:hypothetical protein BJY24_007121 [Nocardia transvalensis]|uniref:Restriction endonuclease n=1 Tax=Nocardia transvalensis TaxID=37333 RepID=A0A7W9PM83_9NOCA|nr:restriction endonuclease [Nocardia transvalensis]MBB5918209.1 hypothetical protein [Nocardia transvalensis]